VVVVLLSGGGVVGVLVVGVGIEEVVVGVIGVVGTMGVLLVVRGVELEDEVEGVLDEVVEGVEVVTLVLVTVTTKGEICQKRHTKRN
jgi:hypothetical protein